MRNNNPIFKHFQATIVSASVSLATSHSLSPLVGQAGAARKVAGATGLGGDSQGVEVALAPEELELDPMAMTQKYEEHVREQQAQVEKEDFSDMVAEHAAKQKVPLQLHHAITLTHTYTPLFTQKRVQ